MFRKLISVFFVFVFLTFLAAPSIISYVDDSIDVSLFYAASEEEENGKERLIDLNVIVSKQSNQDLDYNDYSKYTIKKYFLKKYSNPYLNLIFPPPEQFS